jgi:hypothetical protein
VKKFLCLLFICATAACGRGQNFSPLRPTPVEANRPSNEPPPEPPPTRVYPSTGADVIADVAARYPERLVGGVSPEERADNMRFLRDRIIETGICGGMQLGWNLKRGGPEVSTDFLAWHRDDGDMGVDIGLSYDDTSQPLRLQWLEAGMGATYREVPAPSCE